MDPNAALNEIIDAAVRGDAREMLFLANDLAIWLTKGGFAPTDPRKA